MNRYKFVFVRKSNGELNGSLVGDEAIISANSESEASAILDDMHWVTAVLTSEQL